MPPFIELRNITKTFGPLRANDNISLRFEKGEIYALLGENGAGKTTLMNILYGLYEPDEGEILVEGSPIHFRSPVDAIRVGIGMIHQHFMLAPVLTVAENVMAGEENLKFGFVLDYRKTASRIQEISEQYGMELNPEDVVSSLPVGIQQRVEIVKLLYRNANFLILDEPTAVLNPQEIERLFDVLKSLAAQGKTILFITHKLKEVMAIADKVAVMRAGKLIATVDPIDMNEQKLAELMVGREVVLRVEKKTSQPGKPVLQVKDLQVLNDRENLVVAGATFEVHEGEILGLAGVQGNGQTELIEAITGLRATFSGSIFVDGKEATNYTPRQITELGVGHIPEDRQRDGLVLSSPLTTNIILCSYYKPPFARGIILQQKEIEKETQERIEEFDVRTTGSEALAGSLSGGNQQKVIIAREFSRSLKLLIAAQPTRGLDVGSIEYVHHQIVQKRDHGTAVLLVSTELDEIMSLSDRIAVISQGKIVGIVDAANVKKEQLGLMMAGVHSADIEKS